MNCTITIDLSRPKESHKQLLELATVMANLMEVNEKQHSKIQTAESVNAKIEVTNSPVPAPAVKSYDEYISELQDRARDLTSKLGNNSVLIELLNKYKSNRVTAIPPEQLPDFDEDLKKLEAKYR